MALSKKNQPKRPKAKRQKDSVKESIERDIEVRAELDALKCDPQGIKRLVGIARKVRAEFSSSVKERLLSVGKGVITGDLDFITSYVRAQSILFHSSTSTTFKEVEIACQDDLSHFQNLVSDLQERHADASKVFGIALLKPELGTHLNLAELETTLFMYFR